MSMLNKLFLPDKKALSVQLVGMPGSGKSFFLKKSLDAFLKSNEDENLRVIYICPKHEFSYPKTRPTTLFQLQKSIRKNRLTIFYPDPVFFESETDAAIDLVFALRESNGEDFKAVIILDDAQVILDSRKAASGSSKRLVLTGRSKGIRAVLVAHSPVVNKLMEGSTEHLLTFRLPYVNSYSDAKKRFGVDLEASQIEITKTPYSFAWYDLVKGTKTLMSPIE